MLQRSLAIVVLACLPFPGVANAKPWTYKDLTLQDQPIPASPTSVDGDAAKSDLDFLIFAFVDAYGGFPYLDISSRAAFIRAIRSYKSASTVVSVEGLCEMIGDAMWEFLPDNHIRAKYSRKNCGPKRRSANRIGAVGKNLARGANKAYVLRMVNISGKKVAELGISSFPFQEAPDWEGFDAAINTILASDATIVDLRGNGGGDDARGFQLANALLGTDVPVDWDVTLKRQTPATLTVFRNMLTLAKIDLRASGKEPEAFLDDRIKEVDKKLELAVAGRLPPVQVSETGKTERPMKLAAKGFHGRIEVLVDASCGSSCESTMNALKAHPNAQTLGENTAGYYSFGDVGDVLLPNSKILINLPTKYNKYRDGKIYDKTGFPPDVRVRKGDDALVVAEQRLKQ